MLGALDLAVIKIKILEIENERKEIRLSAMRCRLSELLNNPVIVIIKSDEYEQQ